MEHKNALSSQLDLGSFVGIYDPAKDQWSTGAQAPTYGDISAAAGAIAGSGSSEIVFLDESSTYIYYPESDTFVKGDSNPANVGFPAVATLNGKLHVIGGIKAPFAGYIVMTSSVATHEQYTPTATGTIPVDTKIYIRPDGTIEPATSNITSDDKLTYSFTSDIYQRIVVQKENTIVNGNGYVLMGQSGLSYGISIFNTNNVAVTNLTITQFDTAGIGIDESTNVYILGNTISNNFNNGMRLYNSSNNTIIGNTVTESQYMSGIQLMDNSNNNTIIANNVEQCGDTSGIAIWDSSVNLIYHNNFFNNFFGGASIIGNSINTWDNGLPNGGNYWADYKGVAAYIINQNNQDNHPLTAKFDITSVPLQLPTWTRTPTSSQTPAKDAPAQTNQAQSSQILLTVAIGSIFVCFGLVFLFKHLKHKFYSSGCGESQITANRLG